MKKRHKFFAAIIIISMIILSFVMYSNLITAENFSINFVPEDSNSKDDSFENESNNINYENIRDYENYEKGNLSLYFCPRDDCEFMFLDFINSAKEEISCALFDVGLDSVQNKLLEKEKELEGNVKIVTDDNYLHKFDHSFVVSDSWGLMHHKFCVVDGLKVLTGSMNPTNNGAHKNNNNLIIIKSKLLAQNYLSEFEKMYSGKFKKKEGNSNLVNEQIILEVNKRNITIKNYFCPKDNCAYRIKEELKKANKSIHFMTFSFTNDGIANILLLQQLKGVKVEGVMEARQVSKYSKFQVLKFQGVNVSKDSNKQNMHHKFFVIDSKTVITGSMNPTGGGDSRNDENVVVIEDEEIAKMYLGEFERLQNRTEFIF
jgi:phosphatidylserine/phosphatidylglycerophosphate/cardiolipin synthase-like enzyme